MTDQNIQNSISASYVDGIVYTIVKDFHDILYKTKYDEDVVKSISSKVYENLSSREIKFRKPMEKRVTSTKKKISLKSSSVNLEDITWYKHEDDPQYCYTKDVYLSSGYFPLAFTDSKDIIGAIGEEGIRRLTSTEKKILKNKKIPVSPVDIF